MKLLLLSALTLLLMSCNAQQKEKKFHFASVGWTITVPAVYRTEDSATIFGRLAMSVKQEENNLKPRPNDTLADQPSPRNDNSTYVPSTDRLYKLQAMLNSPERMLLRITDTGRWRVGAAEFFSIIKPIEKDKPRTAEDMLLETRNEIRALVGNDAIIDSTFSSETIGGKKFASQNLLVRMQYITLQYSIYTRLTRNYRFYVTIASGDKSDGKERLLKIWQSSVFKE